MGGCNCRLVGLVFAPLRLARPFFSVPACHFPSPEIFIECGRIQGIRVNPPTSLRKYFESKDEENRTKKLTKDGNRFCIVTNQSGVSRGLIKQKELDNIHDYIKNKFMKNSIPLLGIYIAIDHPNNATIRRKPGVGMFLEASKDHDIDLKYSLIVGDSKNDIQAGKDLGMDTILVCTGRGSQTILDYPDLEPDAIVSNIEEAADWILK